MKKKNDKKNLKSKKDDNNKKILLPTEEPQYDPNQTFITLDTLNFHKKNKKSDD